MKKNFKTFNKIAAQGELLIQKVDKLPGKVKKAAEKDGKFIVGHSETGHHHTVESSFTTMYDTDNPMISFLEVDDTVDLVHERSYDTHTPLRLAPGTYEIRRQREMRPEGWAAVSD